jgi:hypothetical protein
MSTIADLWQLICGLHDENEASITWANSWQGHNLGQMGLVMQRTPEAHVDGHAHDLFVDARMNVVSTTLLAMHLPLRPSLTSSPDKRPCRLTAAERTVRRDMEDGPMDQDPKAPD